MAVKPKLTRIALALLPLLYIGHAHTATVTWVGGSEGRWNLPSNWSGNALPTSFDDVRLGSSSVIIEGPQAAASLIGTGRVRINQSSASLTLSGPAELGSLELELGSFNSQGSTRVSGRFLWEEGVLSGAGSTLVLGPSQLGSGLFERRSLTGGHTLTLAGNTVQGGNHGQDISGGSRIVNQATWTDQASGHIDFGSVLSSTGPSNHFDNQGSFIKSAGFTTTFIDGVAFNSSGRVDVNAGTLRILGGGSSTGSLNVAEGATLAFGNGSTFALGPAITNAGTMTIEANVRAAQGLQLAGNVAVNSGELSLGAASSFVNLSLNRFGAINSSAPLLVTGNLDLTGGFLNGSGTTRSTGELRISGSDSKFLNLSKLVAAGSARQTGTGRVAIGGRVENLGAWSEQATGNNLIDGIGGGASFDNSGTFNKDSAFITTLGGNGLVFNNTGTVNVNAGTLRLNGGGNSSTGQIFVRPGATLEFGGSGAFDLGNQVNNAGTLLISDRAVVNAASSLHLGGLTALNGSGVLILGADSSFAALTLSGSAMLGGRFALVVDGPMQWDGGSLAGLNGSTRVNGSLTLAGQTSKLVQSGHTLVLAGSTQLNEGTLRIQSPFNNQSLLTVASGAELFGNHASFANAGTLAGSGSVRALDTLSNTGTLAPGGVGQVGQLQVLGNLTTSGSLQVELGRSGADLLAVSGNANLGGTLNFSVLSGQRLARGSNFTVVSWGNRSAGSEFANLDFSQLSGYRFATAYGATGLDVTVTAVPFNWTGPASGGFWDVVNNWNDGGDGRPQAGDTVLLGSANTVIRSVQPMQAATVTGTGLLTINSGGTLDLSNSASLGGLNLSGSLNNAGRVVVAGGSTLSGAILSGAGTTRYEGALNISGNRSLLGSGHTLELAGTTTVQGNTITGLSLGSGGRIVNQGSWVEAASGNTSWSGNGGASVFDNQGSFTKTTTTTTTIGSFGLTFNNSGSVNVDAGTLSLVGGGASTGQIDIASGATLDFAGSATYNLNRAVNNAGTFQVRGGIVNAQDGLALGGSTVISGGQLNLSGSSQFDSFNFAGGTLNNNGTLVVSGPTTWGGSVFSGTGSTRLQGPLSLVGASSNTITSGTLVLAGTTTQTGTGNVNTSGGRLVNEGVWLEQATGNTSLGGGGAASFENTGRFSKTSAFTTAIGSFGTAFKNTGTVDVQAGKLQVFSGFNNQGLLTIAAGAELHGTSSAFTNAGTLAGAGTVRAADRLSNTGTLAPGGVGQVGQLQVLGNLTTSGSLQVELGRSGADLLAVSGNANLGGTLNFSVLSGQRLARGSNFTVMSWGNRSAGSEFANLDFSQLSGYRFTTDYGATGLSVTVTGLPFIWTGAAAGGFWDVVNNWNDGGDGLPQAGDAVLLGGADTRIRTTQAVGDVTGTGTLRLDGGGHLILSGSSSGRVGGLALLQGELSNQGRLVASGDSSWVSTTLRGSGGVTRMEGSLAIAGSDFDSSPALLNNHTLELAGSTTFTGRRGMSVGDGGTVVNLGSWVDRATSNVTLGNFNGGTGRFLNQGSFTKASNTRTLIGEGTSLIFESTGSINVDAGYLRLSSSRVSSTGALNIAAGAELSLVSNDATLGGSVFNEGTLSLDGGVLAIAGDLLVQGSGLTRIKSTVNNNSSLRISGSVDWSESTLRGSGSTRMDGTVMLIGDRSRGVLGGQTVELTGTTRQVGTGGLSIGQGAVVRNLGTWLDEAPGNVGIGNFNGGATGRFDNVGTFTKTSAFVTNIGNGLVLNNTGAININAGTLRISGDASLTAGQIQIASGAMLDLASGSIALNGTIQNSGTLALSGATVLVADSATVQGGLTTLNSSTVHNTGRLVLSGNTDWIIATLAGSGSTRMEGAVTLSGSNGRGLTGGHTLELAGSTTQTGTGSLNTGGGARLVNLGSWIEAANGNVGLGNFAGGAPSRFDNVGSFTKTSAFVTDIGNGLVLNNTGTIKVNAGTLRISQAFNNQGQLNVAAGAEVASSVVDFANAGTLAGDGTVRTVGSFFSLKNTGTLAAGGLNDAGTLSLVGGLTQETSGIFLVDLGSTAAGGFDVLSISGAASLTGTLAVNLLDGAHFNVGDSFTVMTWNQRLNNSQFASLDLTHAGGYGFATEYDANSLTLRVTTAVPEPGSWALMALGLLGLGALQRRRRAKP